MDNYGKLVQRSINNLRFAATSIFNASAQGKAYNALSKYTRSPQFKQGAEHIYNTFHRQVAPHARLFASNLSRTNVPFTPQIGPIQVPKMTFGQLYNNVQKSNQALKHSQQKLANIHNKDRSQLTPEDKALLQDYSSNFILGGVKTVGGKGQKVLSQGQARALNKLDDLLHYGQDLRSVGVPAKVIDTLNVHQGKDIIEQRLKQSSVGGMPDFMDGIRREPTDVNVKVNIIDKYLRTPDRVLSKIGLEKESQYLRAQYDKYIGELPKEIDRITAWSKRVSPDANRRIFQYLDGKPVKLAENEQQVAGEIKMYLKEWASKLGLPEDRRVTSYITHIFEDSLIQKEFDDDLAKILIDEVAGSVYDPFVTKRLGRQGYIEDTWRALDAYIKRATRKYNLDPALNNIKRRSETMELSQFKYIKDYVDRVNMRPTEVDNLLDNTIKQVVGYRFGVRPTVNLTRKARRMIYRGTLGLNPGTALKNLSQGANTYAKLGEKYTTIGYIRTIKNLITNSDELERVGVLQNGFIQDQTLSSTQKFWENADKVLFALFETAEKINRGAAYFGAKAQGLNKGMSERDAIEYAKGIVRDTQFSFGSIDTPPILQSDIGKTLLQFQSFTLKQSEFLSEMMKKKDVAGLVRYTAATFLFINTIGKLMGMETKDIIPTFRIGVPPSLKFPVELGKAVSNAPDKWGNDLTLPEKLGNVGNALVPYFPAGTQIKKSVGGYKTINKGYSESASGRVRYPVSQDVGNRVRGILFGEYNLPEARAYRDSDGTVLGEKQSEEFKNAQNKRQYYNQVLDERENDAWVEASKVKLKESRTPYILEDNTYFVMKKDGEIAQIERSVSLQRPLRTGNTEIDKRGLENYRDSLTQRLNEVYILAKSGAISKDSALSETQKLLTIKNGVKAELAGRYVKPETIEDYAKSKIRAEAEADARQVYKQLEDGVITPSKAEALLTDIEEKLYSMKVSGGRTRKAKKPMKISVSKSRKITLPKIELVALSDSQLKRVYRPYNVRDIDPGN